MLLFTHLKGMAAELYALEGDKTPSTSWDKVVTSFRSFLVADLLSYEQPHCSTPLEWKKGQWVADYFAKIMWLL